ncbi:hypothetical protein BDY21DRAFT_354674 [Lineolata rhizophorae]|uniref:Uncharacterized protein n=1 Tax=Lineolata rhizophorae TaxID=578093 RepID=A0A6A6NQH2_9PEZI|nr:hypothetical protein BDY21DRAFT_354674 [Lineolata rhizophorae]
MRPSEKKSERGWGIGDQERNRRCDADPSWDFSFFSLLDARIPWTLSVKQPARWEPFDRPDLRDARGGSRLIIVLSPPTKSPQGKRALSLERGRVGESSRHAWPRLVALRLHARLHPRRPEPSRFTLGRSAAGRKALAAGNPRCTYMPRTKQGPPVLAWHIEIDEPGRRRSWWGKYIGPTPLQRRRTLIHTYYVVTWAKRLAPRRSARP